MVSKSPKRELTRGEKWIALGFLGLILGLFVAEIARDYHPTKLSILFILVWHVPLLLWHEAAHALVASGLGWGVRRVVVGFGPPLVRFKVRSVDVEVRIAPVMGFTMTYPRGDRCPRLKDVLVFFAGPASALLVLGGVILGVGWERLTTLSGSVAMLVVQSLAIAAMVDAVVNLVPMMTPAPQDDRTVSQVFTPNDGMGMLQALLRPRMWYRQQAARWRQVEAGLMRDPSDDI